MTSMSDQEFAQTEALLRQRLAQLATHAPTAVNLPGEVPVVAASRPIGRGRRVGVIAAVTALIGAGGFTTYSFLGASNDGGAATPEEAVLTFVSAVEHEDLLGAIDMALPEEVGELRAAVDSITADAKRVGLLDGSFDAGGVQGVEASIDDLALDTEFLDGGLAKVTATAGTVNATFDPQRFPFGEKVRALLGSDAHAGTTSYTLSRGGSLDSVMTVERSGRWYVSLEYTIAEYVRQAAGWEIAGPVLRTPVGFDSPDAAVTGFYDRLASLDLQGAMDTFAPGEDAMAWLAQAWLDSAQSAIGRGQLNGWTVGISGLTFETTGTGDHLTLRPLTFKIEGTVPAGFGADPSDTSIEPTTSPEPFTIERANDCTTVTGGAIDFFGLGSGSAGVTPVDGGFQICGGGDRSGLFGLVLLTGGLLEVPPISVVQSAGQWYVSPLGTILASVSTGLHTLTDDATLFDSPLAPFLYGGLSRDFLNSMVVGQPVDSVPPECLPALTVENGQISGIAANPSPDAVKACSGLSSSSSTGSGTDEGVVVSSIPIPEKAPPTSSPDPSTPPATTP